MSRLFWPVLIVAAVVGSAWIRFREHFRVVAPAFLLLALGSCAVRPCPDMAYYGGPTWRVFDVDRMDGVESHYAIDRIHAHVASCTGRTRPRGTVRVYFASLLWSKQADGRWSRKAGLHVGGGQIYVSRGMKPVHTAGTIAHELAHYMTGLDHPAIDSILVRCRIPLRATVPA